MRSEATARERGERDTNASRRCERAVLWQLCVRARAPATVRQEQAQRTAEKSEAVAAAGAPHIPVRAMKSGRLKIMCSAQRSADEPPRYLFSTPERASRQTMSERTPTPPIRASSSRCLIDKERSHARVGHRETIASMNATA